MRSRSLSAAPLLPLSDQLAALRRHSLAKDEVIGVWDPVAIEPPTTEGGWVLSLHARPLVDWAHECKCLHAGTEDF
jgi:hypothetical protein